MSHRRNDPGPDGTHSSPDPHSCGPCPTTRFGNYEEKKEDGASSCPTTPLSSTATAHLADRHGDHDRDDGTMKQARKGVSSSSSYSPLLLSPAKTATTVVTSESSPTGEPNPNLGPTSSYTALKDVLTASCKAPLSSPGDCSGCGAQEDKTASDNSPPEHDDDATVLAFSSSSTLPIPLPSRSALLDLQDTGLAYYRVAYRGVVALHRSPPTVVGGANDDDHVETPPSSRSGAYLSYGEVFVAAHVETSHHPADRTFAPANATIENSASERIKVAPTAASATTLSPRRRSHFASAAATGASAIAPPKIPEFTDTADSGEEDSVSSLVLRVLYVLTGGYANEADRNPVRAGVASSGYQRPLGYLRVRSATGEVIAERMAGASLSSPPAVSAGPWTYRIVSASPVPILAGPCSDAPRTAAVLLPGTVHDVSLCYDNRFLRLQHRRGWFPAYRETTTGRAGGGSVVVRVPVAQLLAIDDTAGAGEGNNATDTSLASYSTCSSYSTINNSFASAGGTRRNGPRRHRPPRRVFEQQQDREYKAQGMYHVPRQVASGGGEGSSSTGGSVAASSPRKQQLDEKCSVSLVSDDEEGESSAHSHCLPSEETVYLMRVLHPKGLKILDAPQFAATNLIRGGSDFHQLQHRHAVLSSLSTAQPHRVFSTLPVMRSNPVVVYDSHTKTRRLPCGVFFEARSLLQQTVLHGEGLVQLLDRTGWAMVPSPADVEMVAQASSAHEWYWIRVMARAGLTVACPPLLLPPPTSGGSTSAPNSPSSVRTAAESSSSDIASSVGSAILDVFRTPKKKPQPQPLPPMIRPPHEATVIPCGTMVRVEKSVSGDYARLLGGQGWIPTAVHGKPVCALLPASASPEFRRGSFWFRVQAPRGVRVRTGPSRRAPSIKSTPTDKDRRSSYFRFECGEFLRASEVVTLLAGPNRQGEGASSVAESYCKLYRNRHVQLLQQQSSYEFPTLEAYTTPAEWVQVYSGDELLLEECAQEPRIERHKAGGWKYHVLQQVSVRKGPSFASESTGMLEAGDSVTVNERVAPPASHRDDSAKSTLLWLRLKDGQGWVHDTSQDTGEVLLVPQSLRHANEKAKKVVGKKDEIAYNAIIARLFHNHDDGAPVDRPHHHISGVRAKNGFGLGDGPLQPR